MESSSSFKSKTSTWNLHCLPGLKAIYHPIEKALNHKIFAFGTFLDPTITSIITASRVHDVDDKSTKCIGSMLKNRTVKAEIRGVNPTEVPQARYYHRFCGTWSFTACYVVWEMLNILQMMFLCTVLQLMQRPLS
jgi:hypothetical protein